MRRWILIKGNEALEWANILHKRIFSWVVSTAIILFAGGIILNVTGARWMNIIIALVAYTVGAFFATKPAWIASMFAGGAVINGLPNFSVGKFFSEGLKALPDFELKKFATAGYDLVVGYVKGVAHVFNVVGIAAIVLALVPFEENAFAAVIFLTVAIGFGYYSLLFATEFVWLERITRWTLITGLIVGIALVVPTKAYLSLGIPVSWLTDGKDADVGAKILVSTNERVETDTAKALHPVAEVLADGERKLSDKEVTDALTAIAKAQPTSKEKELLAAAEDITMKNSPVRFASEAYTNATYKKVIFFTLDSYQDRKFTGLRNGKWRWRFETVYGTESKDADGNPTNRFSNLNGFAALNGAAEKEEIEVSDGTVTLSWPFPTIVKDRKPIPIPMKIIIE